MRSFMRDVNLGREPDVSIPAAVGMEVEQLEEMYRLLAIAKYEERYVIRPRMPNRPRPWRKAWRAAAWTSRAALGWVRYPLPVRCGQARLRWSHST